MELESIHWQQLLGLRFVVPTPNLIANTTVKYVTPDQVLDDV